MGRDEEGEQAVLFVSAIEIERGELIVQGAAGASHLANGRDGFLHLARVGRRAKLKNPRDEIEIEPRLDVKRTFGIEHPFESVGERAGRGKRRDVAGDDQPGVAVRTACGDLALLDERDARAALGKKKCGAYADDAAADDEGICSGCHVQRGCATLLNWVDKNV